MAFVSSIFQLFSRESESPRSTKVSMKAEPQSIEDLEFDFSVEDIGTLLDEIELEGSPVSEALASDVEEVATRCDWYRLNLKMHMMHHTDGLKTAVRACRDPVAVISDFQVQRSVEKLLVELLTLGTGEAHAVACEIQEFIPLSSAAAEGNTAVRTSLAGMIDEGRTQSAEAFARLFNISENKLQLLVLERFDYWISQGNTDRIRRIVRGGISGLDRRSDVLQERAYASLKKCFAQIHNPGEEQLARALTDEIVLNTEIISDFATIAFVQHCRSGFRSAADTLMPFGVRLSQAYSCLAFSGSHVVAKDLCQILGIAPSIHNVLDHAPAGVRHVLELFAISSEQMLESFTTQYSDLVDLVLRSPYTSLALRATDLDYIQTMHLRLVEIEELRQARVDLDRIAREQDFSTLYETLTQYSEHWSVSNEEVAGPFLRAARVFGFKEMFAYIDQRNLSRHEVLHGVDSVLSVLSHVEIDPQQFYKKILLQVLQDNGEYPEGGAHHHLIAMVNGFNSDIRGTFQQAKKFAALPELKRLLCQVATKEEVFFSWNKFKLFCSLQQLITQTEVLNGLQKIKTTSPKKYSYVSAIAFHEHSKVDLAKGIELVQNPLRFLGASDAHADRTLHTRKKPSNYVEIPFLDLSSDELVEALVEGALDTLQVHQPLAIKYSIPVEFMEVRTALALAVGQRSAGTLGQAQQPKKVFSLAQKILAADCIMKQNLIGRRQLVSQFLEGSPVSIETSGELLRLLYDESIGLKVPRRKFVAQVHLKSDPHGAIAGDDTGCCMRFGSGKNTVYMFNPNTAIFTVRMKLAKGIYKPIAQSVLTTNADVGITVPELLVHLRADNGMLQRVIPEKFLYREHHHLICDNIEIARNYRQPAIQKSIEHIYSDFFGRYLKLFGKRTALQSDHVLIGKRYTSVFRSLPTRPNTYVPLAPVSYSDNIDQDVYHLAVPQQASPFTECCRLRPKQMQKLVKINIGGVSELTFKDTLSVAYIEGRAYADNPSLMEYLHNLENGLIGKDISNVSKERPNLCLKYCDEGEKVQGYLIAYEGRLKGVPAIYIGDLAADPSTRIAGGKLVKAFIDLYGQHYLEQGCYYPIHAHVRERTSHRLLKRKLDGFARELSARIGTDLLFVMEEGPVTVKGGDRMCEVTIRPRAVARSANVQNTRSEH